MLYHATRADLCALIEREGLIPQAGLYSSMYHKGAVPLVYACNSPVSMRIACALGFRSMRSLIDTAPRRKGRPLLASGKPLDLLRGNLLSDEDIAAHGALVLIADTGSFTYADADDGSHPSGVEQGDYYSRTPVRAERILLGEEMIEFLYDNGLEGTSRPPEWARGAGRPSPAPFPG